MFWHCIYLRAVDDVSKDPILLLPSGSSSPRRMSDLLSFENPCKSRSAAQCHQISPNSTVSRLLALEFLREILFGKGDFSERLRCDPVVLGIGSWEGCPKQHFKRSDVKILSATRCFIMSIHMCVRTLTCCQGNTKDQVGSSDVKSPQSKHQTAILFLYRHIYVAPAGKPRIQTQDVQFVVSLHHSLQ